MVNVAKYTIHDGSDWCIQWIVKPGPGFVRKKLTLGWTHPIRMALEDWSGKSDAQSKELHTLCLVRCPGLSPPMAVFQP